MEVLPLSDIVTNAVGSIYEGLKNRKKSEHWVPGGQLGKNEFLQLLVTELRMQDPLKPKDDKKFIADMANFSALEQMQNLNKAFEEFVKSQSFAHKATMLSLIGKTVAWEDTVVREEENDTMIVEKTGKITGVDLTGDEPQILVEGRKLSFSEIKKVLL